MFIDFVQEYNTVTASKVSVCSLANFQRHKNLAGFEKLLIYFNNPIFAHKSQAQLTMSIASKQFQKLQRKSFIISD